MINIKKILLLLCLFFLFNTLEVDSNSDRIVYLDTNNPYEEDDYYLYFDNMNTYILSELLSSSNIKILSYTINGIKYYASNINELYNLFIKDKSLEEKIYYEKYGINIDSIHVLSTVNDIVLLSKKVHIY